MNIQDRIVQLQEQNSIFRQTMVHEPFEEQIEPKKEYCSTAQQTDAVDFVVEEISKKDQEISTLKQELLEIHK